MWEGSEQFWKGCVSGPKNVWCATQFRAVVWSAVSIHVVLAMCLHIVGWVESYGHSLGAWETYTSELSEPPLAPCVLFVPLMRIRIWTFLLNRRFVDLSCVANTWWLLFSVKLWTGIHVTTDASGACRNRMQYITWLILPVVICLSQRLSHACLSIYYHTVKLRMAH